MTNASSILGTQFHYVDGTLFCEDTPVMEIVEEVGTPVYIYSQKFIEDRYKLYSSALKRDGMVCYSVKANSSHGIIKTLAKLGAGADIVSGGELFRARRAGIDPSKIVFSGVGKTPEEIRAALEAGILMFNVESLPELYLIGKIAEELNKTAPIAIRVNPDVEIKSHPYISTGWRKAKFGLPEEEAFLAYREAAKMSHLEPLGIDCHIGSQILELEPFKEAYSRVAEMYLKLKKEGLPLKYIDFGGGLGITYREDQHDPGIENFVKLINEIADQVDAVPILEPGRSIVGNAGALIGKVLYVKETSFRNFIITDIGMNDLMRPALYRAYHKIVPVNAPSGQLEEKVFDIVGPICETGDFIALERPFPTLKQGDLIAVLSSGAYGFSMSSNYNSRLRPPEVLVNGASYRVIRRRETFEDLINTEIEVE